jgi:hypothetical protein
VAYIDFIIPDFHRAAPGVPFIFGNLSATQSILLVKEAEFFFGKLIVAQLIKAECSFPYSKNPSLANAQMNPIYVTEVTAKLYVVSMKLTFRVHICI